jgi:hypothetical protein
MSFSLISRMSKWYYTLLFFFISFALQYVLVVKFLPAFLIYSSGIKNPDQLFWYSSEYLYSLYYTLGIAGRDLYLIMLTWDFAYALFTGLALIGLIYNLTKKSNWSRLCLLPMIAACFDLIENLCQIILLKIFPVGNSMIVFISSSSSLLKMVLMLACLTVAVIFSVRFFYQRIKSHYYRKI